jgi:glucoamylase
MPLVWAHAEFLKLHAAVTARTPFDRLASVAVRYATAPRPTVAFIRDEARVSMTSDTDGIAIVSVSAFMLHIGVDGWQRAHDVDSTPTVFGLHEVRLSRSGLGDPDSIEWTRHFTDSRTWEGVDHVIETAS